MNDPLLSWAWLMSWRKQGGPPRRVMAWFCCDNCSFFLFVWVCMCVGVLSSAWYITKMCELIYSVHVCVLVCLDKKSASGISLSFSPPLIFIPSSPANPAVLLSQEPRDPAVSISITLHLHSSLHPLPFWSWDHIYVPSCSPIFCRGFWKLILAPHAWARAHSQLAHLTILQISLSPHRRILLRAKIREHPCYSRNGILQLPFFSHTKRYLPHLSICSY